MYQQDNKAPIIILIIVVLLAFLLQLALARIPANFLILILLASTIFFIAFLKTDLALVILIFSMLLSPEIGLSASSGRAVVLRFDDFFIFMLFFGWLARMAVNKEIGFLKTTPINQPIWIYMTICIVASLFGIMNGTTTLKQSFFYNLKYLEYFLIFFLVSNNLSDKKQQKMFIFFMLVTCLIVSIFALATSQGGRATAPFEGESGEPNTLAGYLIVMMGIILGLLLHAQSLPAIIFLGGFFAFTCLPLLFTLSRAGWIGFSVMFVSFVIFSKRHKAILLFVSAILIVAAPTILPKTVQNRFERTFGGGKSYGMLGKKLTLDKSAGARIRSWQDSFEQWKKYPILGEGVASGRVLYDMQYGRLLREVGLFGFLAFAWLIIRLFKAAWVSFTYPNLDNFGQGLSLGFICILMGLLAMGIGAEVFIIIRIMEPFWFLAAMVIGLPELMESSDETVDTRDKAFS